MPGGQRGLEPQVQVHVAAWERRFGSVGGLGVSEMSDGMARHPQGSCVPPWHHWLAGGERKQLRHCGRWYCRENDYWEEALNLELCP